MRRLLAPDEIAGALAGLPGWSGSPVALTRSYSFGTFLAGIGVVDLVAVEAEAMDHHPDIDIRWGTVAFTLTTHSAGGVTGLDVELAGRIHRIATGAGGA